MFSANWWEFIFSSFAEKFKLTFTSNSNVISNRKTNFKKNSWKFVGRKKKLWKTNLFHAKASAHWIITFSWKSELLKIPTQLYPFLPCTFPVGGKPKPELLQIIFLKVVFSFTQLRNHLKYPESSYFFKIIPYRRHMKLCNDIPTQPYLLKVQCPTYFKQKMFWF